MIEKNKYLKILYITFLSAVIIFSYFAEASADEAKDQILPSWKDGSAKETIMEYIKSITSTESDNFTEEKNRIAVFRDDGTLICEKPMLQRAFFLRSLNRLAKKDPKLLDEEPFRSAQARGMKYMDKLDSAMLSKVGAVVREKAGDEFYKELLQDFMVSAKNPQLDVLYTDLVYQPMKELLSYLRAVGFKAYIVSSGDIDFTKAISAKLYDIAPERVLGPDGYKKIIIEEPVKTETKEDTKKVVSAVYKPILAVGRIDEGQDVDMLSYCQSNTLHTLGILVKHDDNEREFSYGQKDQKSLNAAKKNGWLEVSMKNDWKNIFPATLVTEVAVKPGKEKAKPVTKEEPVSEEVTSEKLVPTSSIGITRPLEEKGPTKVQMGLFVIDIDEVNTAIQSFTANIYFALRWWDPRLAHGGKGVVKYDFADVWAPRILLMNQQRMWKTFADVVEVDSSGEVKYTQRLWGQLSQPLNLRDFPFDQQVLNFAFVIPGYTPQEIEFLKDESRGFGMSEKFSVPDWDVTGWDSVSKPFIPFEGRELSALTFSLKMNRRAGHYIYKVILPLIFIVMMSWVVFWIDPEAVGVNIAAATTSFLTLVAYRFAIGASIPQISYFTRLDAFVFCATILVFVTLMHTIALSYLCSKKKQDLARKLDFAARFVYPLIFVVMIVVTLVYKNPLIK